MTLYGSLSTQYYGDGGPATAAGVKGAKGIAVAPDGSIYIAEGSNQRIRLIDRSGIITTVAGNGQAGGAGDGGAARASQLNSPAFLDVAPDGALLIADVANNRVRQVASPLPGVSTSESVIADAAGVAHVFDAPGRHMRTIDTTLGIDLLPFAYDSAGRLTTVTDVDSNVTTIQRNGSGIPTGILAPFGQLTTLTVDSAGFLASIINPAADTVTISHGAGGLLASFTTPRGYTSTFTYDSIGRLTRDDDAASGYQILARTDTADGYITTRTTAEDLTTAYGVTSLATGGVRKRITDPAGFTTTITTDGDESTTALFPESTTVTTVLDGDPRFGMQVPIAKSVTTELPSGLTRTITASRAATLTDPLNPFSLTQLTDTLTLNGRVFRSVYDHATRRTTTYTPLNRQSTADVDSLGRLVRTEVTGITPTTYTYDAHGRPTGSTQGTREWTLEYDSAGYLASVTDPLDRVTRYTYDAAGRVTEIMLPDSSTTGFAYDPNSNITSLTPSGKPAHGFTFTAVDLPAQYAPPTLSGQGTSTAYTFDLDRRLAEILRPDSAAIEIDYDPAGWLSTISYSQGQLSLKYNSTTGMPDSLLAPGGVKLAKQWDGGFLTRETWSGPVAGQIDYTYNTDFNLASITIAGGAAETPMYDDDGLLTGVGTLTLTRSSTNGRITGVSLGSVSTGFRYDSFGALDSLGVKHSTTPLFEAKYTRDALDWITRVVETVDTVVRAFDYAYDLAGRLVEVLEDSQTIAVYAYDTNGNRTSYTSSAGTVTGTHDEQDRLLTWGSSSFTYTPNGELAAKVTGSDTTEYTYDGLGNLLSVRLPSDTVISYVVDGFGRRVGRKVEGALVQRFLYSGPLQIVAELDSTGGVVSRFYFGNRGNVPAYMDRDSSTYRLITDHRGSVRLVVDTANGNVVQRLDYDAFGTITLDTNPGFQPFGFAGGLRDDATGLVRFGARDYDPAVGRWTAKDPIGFGGRDANLYQYALGDPINFIDPFGQAGIPPDVVDAIAGFGDALLLNFGDELRDLLGVEGVDECSEAYQLANDLTSLATLFLGTGRLAYATLAKSLRLLGSAERAVFYRNFLKVFFRTGLDDTSRILSFEQALERYGTAEEIVAAAGRTNLGYNAAGAAGMFGGLGACSIQSAHAAIADNPFACKNEWQILSTCEGYKTEATHMFATGSMNTAVPSRFRVPRTLRMRLRAVRVSPMKCRLVSPPAPRSSWLSTRPLRERASLCDLVHDCFKRTAPSCARYAIEYCHW